MMPEPIEYPAQPPPVLLTRRIYLRGGRRHRPPDRRAGTSGGTAAPFGPAHQAVAGQKATFPAAFKRQAPRCSQRVTLNISSAAPDRFRAADTRAIRASGLAQIDQFRRPQLRVAMHAGGNAGSVRSNRCASAGKRRQPLPGRHQAARPAGGRPPSAGLTGMIVCLTARLRCDTSSWPGNTVIPGGSAAPGARR